MYNYAERPLTRSFLAHAHSRLPSALLLLAPSGGRLRLQHLGGRLDGGASPLEVGHRRVAALLREEVGGPVVSRILAPIAISTGKSCSISGITPADETHQDDTPQSCAHNHADVCSAASSRSLR